MSAALAGAAGELTPGTVDGVRYWWRETGSQHRPAKTRRPQVWLLPAFDEYTVAYHDRMLLVGDHTPKPVSKMSLLSPAVLADGHVVGTWKRVLARTSVTVEVKLTREMSRPERESLHAAVKALGRFLGLEAHLPEA